MGYSILKVHDDYNSPVYTEFVVDEDSDIQNLPGLAQCAPGSKAFSIASGANYYLTTTGTWKAALIKI